VESVIVGDGLKAKVIRGGAWLGGGNVAEQAARFGRNMILTRILAPEAFGAMAIVLSATSVIQSFTDIGVQEGLIQNRKGGQREYVDAAWWLGVARALSLAATLFVVAPWVARFYGNNELTPLLRLASVAIVLGGAVSPRMYVAVKEMKFRKLAGVSNLGGICGVVITIVLSFLIRDVWALMIGYCAESAARCVLSYVLCPYVPSMKWNKEATSDLLRFSKGLFGLSFLNLIFARADIFVLAKLCSPTALGLYTMAIYLVQTPVNFIMNMLGQTLMPALSQIQTDSRRTNKILIQVSSTIVMLGLPALAFVFFCGRSLLTLAYGSSYAAVNGALVLASAVALVNLLNGQITTVFYARGLPHLHRLSVGAMAVSMMIAIYPLAVWLGPMGGQAAALLAVIVGYLVQLARVRGVTGLSVARYCNSFPVALLISLTVVVLSLGSRFFAVLDRPGANLVVGIAGCVVAYIIAAAAFLRQQKSLVHQVVQREQ
jgi:O-antigen/teichoic acid export membrane protein